MLFGKHINKYYKRYGILLLIGVLTLLLVDYISVYVPRLFGEIVDQFSVGVMTTERLKSHIMTFILMVSVMVLGRVMWRIFLFGTSRTVQYDMRKELFDHAMSLDQPYFQTKKVGALMAYFSNDLEVIRQSFGRALLLLMDGLFLIIIVAIRMFQMNVMLTLVSIIPLTFLGIVAFFIIRKMRMKFRLRQDSFEEMNEFTQESFSGIQVIKAFVKEVKEAMFFKERSDDFYNKHMDFVKEMIKVQIIVTIFINLTAVTILIFGSYTAIVNPANFTAGNLTEFFALFSMLTWPVMALTQYANLKSQSSASYSRVAEFLDSKPLIIEGGQEIEIKGNIRFNNLSFAYPDEPDKNVLTDVCFEIKEGESVGIIGRTGSGKTTLVDLFLRIYNVGRDMLYMESIDIMDLSIRKIRDQIAYVPQDNFLYSTTIRENIAFSSSDLTDDEITESAKLADIYDNVIEFKHGFETLLGERGVTVSGGQKQRISIARALAKDAPILIFDDSVSAVDTNTEDTILSNLSRIRKGKTTIIIAHRISTVRKLDKIVLLDKGHVLDVGTHDELLSRNKSYQELVERQTLERKVSGDA